LVFAKVRLIWNRSFSKGFSDGSVHGMPWQCFSHSCRSRTADLFVITKHLHDIEEIFLVPPEKSRRCRGIPFIHELCSLFLDLMVSL
jgi:hypothetical protein